MDLIVGGTALQLARIQLIQLIRMQLITSIPVNDRYMSTNDTHTECLTQKGKSYVCMANI